MSENAGFLPTNWRGTLCGLALFVGLLHVVAPPVAHAAPAGPAAGGQGGALAPRPGLSGSIMPGATGAVPAGVVVPVALVRSAGAAASRAQAQALQDPQGQTVEAIEIVGNQRLDDATIFFYLSTRVGAPYDAETARQDFQTLLNTALFDDLAMRWRPGEAGGVVVVIELTERPMLRTIRIEGTEKVDFDDLQERMELLEMSVDLDSPVDRQRLRVAREVLTTMLQGDEGLNFVQVELDLVESQEGAGVDALFSVVEGDEVRIEMVNFEGASVFTQRELRWMMGSTGEHWLASFLTKNDRFSPAGYERDMVTLQQTYWQQGYLDFAWDPNPEVEVHTVDRPLFLDPAQRLFITVDIDEGPQYRVRNVTFEGNEAVTDEQMRALFPLAEGEVANIRQVIDAQNAIKTLYQTRGYLQVFVGVSNPRDAEEGWVDFEFTIQENDQYTVRRIDFEGNSNTRDYVLRRNLRLNEQETWNFASFQRSLYKIYQLGYFDNIEPELLIADDVTGDAALPGSQPGEEQIRQVSPGENGDGPGPGEVDLKLNLTEVGRNQVSFGGGVSALEGGFVQFGYTTRNLFGRGQTLSFFGQFGGRRTNARISFYQPYFMGKPVRFGFDLFRDALDFFDFQREGTGISTRLGFPLDDNEFLTLFTEYNYEFIDIGDIDNSFFGLTSPLFRTLFFEEGQRTTSSVRPFLTWNTVDNPFNPSRGKTFLLSMETAGGILGGTLDFWKAQSQFKWYEPTVLEGRGVGARVKQILAFNVEARYGGTYGDLEELPIFERFFLGGSQSVRGTRLRAIGPVDEFGNIIGGDKALQYNLEYIFQLADPLRLAFFHDNGGAWAPHEDLSLGEMRPTAGVEFRVFAPVFNVPFRFFWAYNFDPRVEFGEEKSTFEFAIGSTF